MQLHVEFMKFHNALIDLLRSQGTAEESVFAEAPVSPQPSKKIDSTLSLQLAELPGFISGDNLVVALAERNMRRAKALGLPSGQQVAAHMGEQVLTNEAMGLTDPGLGGE
ncbi:MAG: hypothetical protein ACRDJ2_11325, partial [Actinomycetota bacterium]